MTMLTLHPTVEGNLGLGTKNIHVARFDLPAASLTPTIIQEAGLEVGDTVYITDSLGVSTLYIIAGGFSLTAYDIGGVGGATNLGYIASAADGTVTSDTGTNATLPVVTPTAGTNEAGLMIPADKTKLDALAAGTDLGYIASAADGTVTSSDGTNATIPIVTPTAGTNEAGLMKPEDKDRIEELLSTETPTFSGVTLSGTDSSLTLNRLTTTQRNALTPVEGMVIYNLTTDEINYYSNAVWSVIEKPPVEQNYTPTIGDGTNDFTTSTATGRYVDHGLMRHVWIDVTWTGKGSAVPGSFLLISLPSVVSSGAFSGTLSKVIGISGSTDFMAAAASGSNVNLLRFGGTPWAQTPVDVSMAATTGTISIAVAHLIT